MFLRQTYLAEDVSQLSGVSLGDRALLNQCKNHNRKSYLCQSARVRLRVYIFIGYSYRRAYTSKFKVVSRAKAGKRFR